MNYLIMKKLFLGISILLFLTGTALAQTTSKSKAFTVTTPDGVSISAQEWGNPNGPELVLIHGIYQSHLAWTKQVDSDLAREFRIITYDLRGHGGSDKILDKSLYDYGKGEKYADELAAVIAAAQLKKPVLVGWSYGAAVVSDYIRKYGTKKIAGINYVGAPLLLSDNAEWRKGPGLSAVGDTISDDLEKYIRGTRNFLRACFKKQPSEEEFEKMLCYNAMVPAKIRSWLRHPYSYGDVAKALDIPVLLTHGTDDALMVVGMIKHLATLIPNVRLSLYEGIGHSPFWEDTSRFNTELASFTREVHGQTK